MKKVLMIFLIVLILSLVGANIYISLLFNKVNNLEISKIDTELGIKYKKLEKENQKRIYIPLFEFFRSPFKDIDKPVITNIALFGIDDKLLKRKGSSDTIIIASLDLTHKKIKLTSILRDTYVEIPDIGMDKITYAYSYGGPELSIKTINQNFDMNIREFVTVNFEGLEQIIDALGGINITIKDYEVAHIPGIESGPQILNGKQTLTYTRIRDTGKGDIERTERQRSVLEKIINKGLDAGIAEYPKILNTLLPYVDTSLSKNEMLKLGISTLSLNIKNIEQFRIPTDNHVKAKIINEVYFFVPDSLENNVNLMHEFIYSN